MKDKNVECDKNNYPLFFRYYKEWQNNLITKEQFAELLGVNITKLDRLLKDTKIEADSENIRIYDCTDELYQMLKEQGYDIRLINIKEK